MILKKIHTVLLFLLFSFFGNSQILSVSGYYEGMNLFVSNPIKNDGYGYCIHKVLVNGNVLPASIQTDYFEIDLTLFSLKKGDEVFIELEHGEGCTPSFVNPEVLLPFSTFEVVSITANAQGKISWSTKNESGKLTYLVEQYKWDRWVVAAEVLGKGSKSTNNYAIEIIPTSGYNKVRVAQIDNTGVKRHSKSVGFTSTTKSIKKSPSKVKSNLYFKAEGVLTKTKYELYDAYGNLLKKGFVHTVDCTDLLNGIYNINYDNKSEKFIKY
jgi:hypothetical protein